MKTALRWRWLWSAGLGFGLAASSGCQTWVAGMTLPSGHYLQHPPQYIPPDPPFPLPLELAGQEEAAAAGPIIPPPPGPLGPPPPPPGPIPPGP
jgi:hypothetical protein